MPQLPDNLLLHTFGFLDVPSLVSVLATDRHWRALAAARSLWKPACRKEWPAMMEQLGYCLDAQPDAYRCFYFKNRRSAYEAQFERAMGGRLGGPAAAAASGRGRGSAADEAAAARAAALARARRQYLASFFQDLLLFVDLRHGVSGKPLHSMAIPLTLENVRKLFKADMRESTEYEEAFVGESFLVQEGMDLDLGDDDAEALAAAVEGAGGAGGVRFDLTLFHKKSKTMALLGQGQADVDQRVAGYGPRFGGNDADKKECRFFGEGAEFLCAVPLFAWVFASASADHRRMTLHALAIEVHYVDTADTSVRPQDELLECLHQIFRKELVWV